MPQTLQVPGAELPYTISGTGHPLVLIHAGVADSGMWDAQVQAFAPYFQVIRYDWRGCGGARAQGGEFSHRADLLALLDQLEIAQAHLVGLSFGGKIATDFTLEHPERVSALVLAAAGLNGFDCALPAEQEARFELMEHIEEQGDLVALNELEINTWVSGFHRPPEAIDPAIRQLILAMNMNNLELQNQAGQHLALDPPASERLSAIAVPTLVMWGDLDVAYTQAASAELARGIPGAQQRIFPGAAHMLNLEAPDAFNQAVLEFLQAQG